MTFQQLGAINVKLNVSEDNVSFVIHEHELISDYWEVVYRVWDLV